MNLLQVTTDINIKKINTAIYKLYYFNSRNNVIFLCKLFVNLLGYFNVLGSVTLIGFC